MALRLVILDITAHQALEPLLSTLANQVITMIRPEGLSSKAVCAVDLTSICQAGETRRQHHALLDTMLMKSQMQKCATNVPEVIIVGEALLIKPIQLHAKRAFIQDLEVQT